MLCCAKTWHFLVSSVKSWCGWEKNLTLTFNKISVNLKNSIAILEESILFGLQLKLLLQCLVFSSKLSVEIKSIEESIKFRQLIRLFLHKNQQCQHTHSYYILIYSHYVRWLEETSYYLLARCRLSGIVGDWLPADRCR